MCQSRFLHGKYRIQPDAAHVHAAEVEQRHLRRWRVYARLKRRLAGRSSPSSKGDARSYTIPLVEVFRIASKQCSFISIDPEVMAGAPCISGTRIPVYGVLDAVDYHGSLEGALKSYPRLKIEQVKDAVLFAKLVVECPVED